MNDQEARIKRLAEALVSLSEFVPASKDDLDQWYTQAEILKGEHLLSPGSTFEHEPFFLWHYLSDADIRMKDPVYAEMQNGQLSLLLEYLNRGEMPSDEAMGAVPLRGCRSLVTRWFRW